MPRGIYTRRKNKTATRTKSRRTAATHKRTMTKTMRGKRRARA